MTLSFLCRRSFISLKLLLYEFEMITDVKINFYKSFVYNLSGSKEVGTRATNIFNCNLNSLLFTYLGISIKVISLTSEDWQPLIERVEKWFVVRKCNALFWGGRLILVNSVVSSTPLYVVSFYHILVWVIHAIDRIRRAFFWKGTRNTHENFTR